MTRLLASLRPLLLLSMFALTLGATCNEQVEVHEDLREVSDAPVGLAAGDLFEIRVYGEEQLSAEYRVDEDGTIDFPFLGRVPAEGASAREMAERIAEGLQEAEIMIDPQVTVLRSESQSTRVSVMGAVAQPGTFPVTPGMTVIQAISQAGGFSPLASRNNAVLTRQFPSGQRRFPVPAGDISRGEVADIPMQAGDILFIPERVF